ncbi:VirB4 family type IV secretion system protein [Insolitispirillum peregrinum]|uniref:VirB4 family type IV secretion system protein n=1 Tax=Insolitispirillum peregrinum TaxID=80876 RepID=UPI00360FDDDF
MSLWPFVGTVTAAAALAATVAVPAARKWSVGDIRQDWLCGELDLDRIDADRATVWTKTGTVCRVFAIVGEPYETKPLEEQTVLLKGRTQLFDQLAAEGVGWRLFGVKRRRPMVHTSTWPSPVLKIIGDAEEALYRESYSIHWYLMVSAKDLYQLDKVSGRIMALLRPYKVAALESPENRTEPCLLTGFLNFLVCGDLRTDLPALSANLSATLPAGDATFNKDGLLTIALPAPVHHRLIVVRRWPELVSGQIIGDLLTIDGEIDLTQVCLPERKELASAVLLRKAREQGKNPFAGAAAQAETEAVLDQISGGAGWLKTQFHVTVRAADPARLAGLVRQVTDILAHYRVIYSVETEGTPVAWFNRQPDHNRLLRPLKVTAEAVSALWPFAFAPVGRMASPWGTGPIRCFATSTGQAYSLQFHLDARKESLGHFMVFAPSGVGKSTLLMHLLGGQTKHTGVPAYVCDSKEGTRFMVEVMGGSYQNYDRLSLNPLAVAENTSLDRQRLRTLILSMLGEAAADPETDEIIGHMLETAFMLEPHQRSFNALFATSFPPNSPQRRAMAKWVVDNKGRAGQFAHIFNAPRDSLTDLLTDAPIVGINMNEALEDPLLGPPVIKHMFDTITRCRATGKIRGATIFVDEAANLLRNQTFATQIEIMFRELRKANSVVGMAFQEPNALMESGIAATACQNVASLFFYPNPGSNRESYKIFNLNDEQLDFILNSAPLGRRVLLVKRDQATGFEESVILNVDLSALDGGNCLKYYRSGPGPVLEIEKLQAEWGASWRDHL